EKVGLIDTRIMSLFMNGEELWAGSMVGGVSVVKNDVVIETFTTDPNDANSISSNAISRIIKDKKGRIWLTTYGGGVNQYLGQGRFKRYPDVTNPYGAFNDLRAVDIVEAADGTMWIATDGGGVTVLDPESGDTMSFRHDPEDETTLSSDNVISLLRTEETIWVGTRDRGMNRFITNGGSFKRYSKGQGLASDAVYGMLEDTDGHIWVSGGKGLSVLNPVKETFQYYDSTHGLQSDDFNSGAYLKLSDNSFIYGGNNGFNAFDPARISRNQYVPPIRLTSFSKFNKEFDLPAPIDRTDLIELDYSDFVIGFEFAALDYTAPKKNQFKYKLEGFDRDWVDSGNGRQATYTNLDAGTYVFRVKGSNNDGVWNEEGTQLKLVVNPPIWATWWAYLIYLLLFALGLYQLLQANTQRQKREAEKKYSERLQLYIESLEEATDCVLIADNRGNLLYANNAIRSILGQTPAEAVGRPLVSVVFENEEDSEAALSALEEHGRYHGEVTYQTDTGESLTTEVTIAAVRELSEHGSAYVSISRDITDRKKTEAELEDHRRNLEYLVGERTSALEKEIVEHKAVQIDLANSLEDKELLLKEVHHRVKNNMQVISSLLNIQAETAGNHDFADLLGASQQRIKSMSLIHENLYQSDNFSEIDFEDYIRTLATSLCRFYAVPGVDILLDINVDNVSLDLETAVPCGLIINEIISNSLKHAFENGQGTGTISVDFRVSGCSYVLNISDDGKGLPEDFQLVDGSSMGMEIVSILTQQLDGKIKIVGNQGAAFKISFPRKTKHEL
ncbi:MAG: triple tyrosine motif-containing protein, partial [Gammaproteobacteria bacterium]|nr:triple tyrosine motif-containing protein [Gammaproteobacteria bacterium]